MILYTPMPLEEVLDETEENRGEYLEIPYNNGIIEIELTSASTAKVARLRSSNINDYLDPRLQPGAEIRIQWMVN